jgi:lipopolysaccharide export system protein LptA
MLKRCFRNSLFIIAALFLIAATSDAARPDKNDREPLVITSNRMEADRLGDKVTFTENVTLKKEGMTLTSDSMIVFYSAGSKDIREIEASGNVVVRKEGRVALSDYAWYYSSEEKIVLTGDARIIENENQLGGDKITLFMRDDRSIVEGGKVLFYQNKQEKPADSRKRK